MEPINKIAVDLGIRTEHLVPYGHYKAKISLDALAEGRRRPQTGDGAKLIVVTGITPTPAGEGKTTTAIGLTQGMGKLGLRPVVNLREPSLGPIYGIKGGGTGGGRAMVVPEDEINIHFTGDAHAVASTHNLLAALVDNAVYRDKASGMDPTGIQWSRVTDASDRALRQVVTGLGGSANSTLRETRFDIVTASEIMALLALSDGLEDMRNRLSRIVVGSNRTGDPVSVADLGVTGALMTVMRHAIMPNLVQTLEGQPALIHAGPFGNIAHGCNSILADRIGLAYADYVVTEAGFGADLGFEKFMHIKARQSGLVPDAVVMVASLRALRWHGGATRRELARPNLAATTAGGANLDHLARMITGFGLPLVVAINRFEGDSPEELEAVRNIAQQAGAAASAEISGFTDGGEGGIALAEAVIQATSSNGSPAGPSSVQYAYELDSTVEEKVLALAQRVYGASDVSWSAEARRKSRYFQSQGWGQPPHLHGQDPPFHIPTTPRSGAVPPGTPFPITDIRASIGAGFLYTLAGRIETPTRPTQPTPGPGYGR